MQWANFTLYTLYGPQFSAVTTNMLLKSERTECFRQQSTGMLTLTSAGWSWIPDLICITMTSGCVLKSTLWGFSPQDSGLLFGSLLSILFLCDSIRNVPDKHRNTYPKPISLRAAFIHGRVSVKNSHFKQD